MTAGTKAHREGRQAARAVEAPAPAPAAELPAEAPAPAVDWSDVRPLCEQLGTDFQPHSRRPWECRLCGRPDTAHPVRWVRRDDGRPVRNPSQVDIVRRDVVRAPAPAAELPAEAVDQVDTVPAAEAPAPAAELPAEAPAVWSLPLTEGYGKSIGKATRARFRELAVTVVGPVAYEPSMLRVRDTAGKVHRAFREHVTMVDTVPAAELASVPAPAVYGVFAHSPAGAYPRAAALTVCATETAAEEWISDHIGDASVGAGRALVVEPLPAAEAGHLVDTVPAPAPAAEAVDQGTAGTVPAADQGEKIMRATVNRADLVAALAYVVRGIGRPAVPVLSGIVCTVADGTLTVHTFDWETLRAVDLVADGAGAGTLCVPGKPLREFVSKLPKKAVTVDLVASAGALTVSAGGVSASFDELPGDVPPVPAAGHVIGTVPAGTLADLVGRVAPAAGVDETQPILTMVRVRTSGKSIDVATSDRYRIHAATGTWEPAEESPGFLVAPGSEYAVPAVPLSQFASAASAAGKRAGAGAVTVTVADTLIGGMAGHAYGLSCAGYRLMVSCSLSEYPAVDGLWPESSNGTVTAVAADLVDLVTRVTAGRDKKSKDPVIVRFDSDQVTAEYYGDSRDGMPVASGSMPAIVAGNPPAYVAANPAYLVACVTAVATGAKATVTLALVDSLKPVIMTSDSAEHARVLLMPIRATIGVPPHTFRARPGVAGKCDVLGCTSAETAPVHVAPAPAPAAEAADQGNSVPAAEAPAEAPEAHAYVASVHNPNRCAVTGCGAGRSARAHRAARQTERAEREARIAAGEPAGTVPAVESVALVGPIVDSIDSVKLLSGVPVVANGSTLGYIASATRRNRTDGFDLMTGGAYTTHYATRQVAPAVIGATVCATPALRGCQCAGKLHVSARELRNLPRLADQVDQVDTVPAAELAAEAPAPAARDLVDGRPALAGMVTPRVPEKRAVAILPAGALAAVTENPRPADFDPFRDEIRGCECPLCNECAYAAHHWCDRRDQVHAARVLLAHLMAGTHVPMTIKEVAVEARAHRADLVEVAEQAGVTGEALDRIRDPHAYTLMAARAAKRDEFENGLGLGVTIGGTFGTARSREYLATRAADVARAAAAVPAAEAPAPAIEPADQGDTVLAAELAAEAPAGAPLFVCTWAADCTAPAVGSRLGEVVPGRIMKLDVCAGHDGPDAVADQGDTVPAAEAVAAALTDAAAEAGIVAELPAEPFAAVLTDAVAEAFAAAEAPAPADQVDSVPAAELPAARLVFPDTADQVDSVPAPAVAGTLHGAHAQTVYVSEHGMFAGFRFHVAPLTPVKALAKTVRQTLGAQRATFGASFHVTAPAGTRTLNIAPKDGHTVADWSPVLARVAELIGSALVDSECTACDQETAVAE